MALTVDIQKTLGAFELNVSFETGAEVMALLGPSGCGKSMTLKCIAGIEKPDRGRIELDGRVLFDSSKRVNLTPQERRVGYLFQQYALFPNMTVEKNIAEGALRRPKAERPAAVADMVRRLHLEGLEKKKPSQLSGGQQQRVALARILINEPELLLLDEPFSALDSALKWSLELELGETLSAFGREAVYVSHDPDEVARLCSTVCCLENGKSGEKRPVSEYFSELARGQGKNLVTCRVVSAEEGELCVRLTLETPDGFRLAAEMPQQRWLALENPGTVQVAIDPQKIMLIK